MPPWRLEYDGAGNPYTATGVVIPKNTGQWKLQTFHLPDAVFQKRENGASDLRIDDYNTQGVVHYFNRFWITTSPPSGQPPQMPLLADVTLEAGDSADIAISAMDSESSPLSLRAGSPVRFCVLIESLHFGCGPTSIQ